MTDSRRFVPFLLCMFALSGFSGLIYESVWAYYLKLFLGHAAYAQSLVLAIFMGGMAIGAVLAGRFSIGWRAPLLAYAVAEALIGVLAIVFHGVFDSLVTWSYASVLPSLGNPAAAQAWNWALAALLIAPQSILLGTTFPLMAAGVIRVVPADAGRILGGLYFANSIGAVFGVLTSGFALIPRVGLPGTVLTAGLVNVALAMLVWLVLKRQPEQQAASGMHPMAQRGGAASAQRVMYAVACLTGLSSFIYEIGWVRMLSLVLGSSTNSFEIMLAAFILGLALGGYWIRGRIDRMRSAVKALAWAQVAMGLLAGLSLLLYEQTFELMRWLMAALSRSGEGYALYMALGAVIPISVMAPPAFCAGMTLPLITFHLLKSGAGESSIGSVYAWNTIGAIAGVLFATHLGMPLLGLKHLIGLGAAIDVVLGVWLFWRYASPARGWVSLGVFGSALATMVAAATLDPLRMSSGVYRSGQLLDPSRYKLLFHEDGKTSSVAVTESDGGISIRTNGKVDARIRVAAGQRPSEDETTMILLAAIPLAIHPRPRLVANIGFGSGLTSAVLLGSGRVERLDTVEIEPAMVRGAEAFRPRVDRAYTDPRSRIHIEDAKAFFAVHNAGYDLIVSEPSNPWVSGVSSLFTVEFYTLVKRHLRPGGLLVQWLQSYELDVHSLATVMVALGRAFGDYSLYALNDIDLLLVARADGAVVMPRAELFGEPGLRPELERIGISHVTDLTTRYIGDKALLAPMFATFGGPANSDYFPVLDVMAARDRFRRVGSDVAGLLLDYPLVLELLDGLPRASGLESAVENDNSSRSDRIRSARTANGYFVGEVATRGTLQLHIGNAFAAASRLREDCADPSTAAFGIASLEEVSNLLGGFLTIEEQAPAWASLGASRCWTRLSEPQRAWVRFRRAVAMRDVARIVGEGEALLGHGPRSRTEARYLILHLGAALVRAGQGAKAHSMLTSHFAELAFEPNEVAALAYRMVLAQAARGG